MNNFWQRALTGTVFVAVLVGAILLGGWYLHITFGLIVILGLLEFYNLFEKTESQPQLIVGTLIGGGVYFSTFILLHLNILYPQSLALIFILIVFIFISIVELFRQKKKPFENIALTYVGIVYIVVPFIFINLLADTFNGFHKVWPLLSVFILIWCNDTLAYLTGRLFGKHKLFERISPKKTWEGFIGGLVFAMIAGILLAYFLEESYAKYITYALVAGIIGTLGDLVQSMLKRSVDVKDSGNILPGHGGILDRFDAVLFVVPVIFFLEQFIFN